MDHGQRSSLLNITLILIKQEQILEIITKFIRTSFKAIKWLYRTLILITVGWKWDYSFQLCKLHNLIAINQLIPYLIQDCSSKIIKKKTFFQNFIKVSNKLKKHHHYITDAVAYSQPCQMSLTIFAKSFMFNRVSNSSLNRTGFLVHYCFWTVFCIELVVGCCLLTKDMEHRCPETTNLWGRKTTFWTVA